MTQPEALRLADLIRSRHGNDINDEAAAELRRLHKENELLASAADKLRMVWRDEVHCLMQDKRQLIAQRDALLEALERMASIIDKMGDMPDGFIHPSPWQELKCEEALTQARAAIKKVQDSD